MYNYIKYILIIFIILNNHSSVEAIARSFISLQGSWSLASNWNPAAVPSSIDDANLNLANSICIVPTGSPANAKTITVGTTTIKNVTLIQTETITCAANGKLTVNAGSYYYSQLASPQKVNIDNIYNYGTVETYGLFDSYSLMQNYGTGIFKSYCPTGLFGYLNRGIFEIRDTIFISETMFANMDNGVISIINTATTVLGSYNTDIKFLGNSVTAFFDSNFTTITNTSIYGSSKVYFNNTIWSQYLPGFNPSNPVNYNFFQVFESSILISENSQLLLGGIGYVVADTGISTFSQSKIDSNYVVIVVNNGKLELSSNSNLKSTGSVMLDDNGVLYAKDSIANITYSDFLVRHNSSVIFERSVLDIVQTSDNAGLGLFNTAKMIFFDNSKLDLNGVFYFAQNSTVTFQDSTFDLKNTIFGNDNTIFQFNRSILQVSGSFYSSNQTTVYTYDSNIYVTGNVGFYETSTTSILSSNLTIQQSFKMDVNTSSLFLNTNIYISGVLGAYGYSNMINSNVKVAGHLGSYGSFNGVNSVVEVLHGDLIVGTNSNFSCVYCVIDIQAGNVLHMPNGVMHLVNSTLNNANGNVVAQGNIYVQKGSSLLNKSNFTLESNIYPADQDQNLKVVNNVGGNLTVSGSNPIIQVPVVNDGSINIVNSVQFVNFTQTKGDILLNGGVVTMISTQSPLELLGGLFNGNGTINGTLSNRGGSIGSSQTINQLSINGNFTHSDDQQSSLTMTIVDNTTYSQINVDGVADLSGTIIVRINQNIVNSTNVTLINYSSSPNVTKPSIKIVTYDPDTGNETPIGNQDCKYQYRKSDSKLEILVDTNNQCDESNGGGNSSNDPKLSKGAIIGIVVGCVVGAAIVGVIIHQRNKIPKHLQLKYRLRSLQGEVNQANKK